MRVLIEAYLTFIEAIAYRIRTFFFFIFSWFINSDEALKRVHVTINGKNPWDPQFKGDAFTKRLITARIASQGPLGLAETYMEGLWEVEDLEELLFRVINTKSYEYVLSPFAKFGLWFLYKMFNLQTKEFAKRNVQMHYEAQNDVIRASMGPTLNYTCADWRNADNVDQAQTNKMELIAQKLKLKPGMRVLDIGCGWGALCKYLAENHGVTVVGVNICKESVAFCKKYCKGLPIDVYLMDYRDAPENLGQFDRVTCIEMIEHVGASNYKTLFQTVNKCLKDDGIFVMQATGVRNEDLPQVDNFSNKYIFGYSMLPYASQILKASKGSLTLEDWMCWGSDNYHSTLMAWWDNFEKAWPTLKKETGRDDVFYRMWKFYFMVSAAGFRARIFENYQIVFSKEGTIIPYNSVR